MRNLQLGCAAFLIFSANAPQALAWETDYAQGANPTASAQYADPDEQFDAMADGGSSGSVLIYNFGGTHSNKQPITAVADQSVHWSAERIRTVFGPEAHY